MGYITVFTSLDSTEVAIIGHLFDREGIDHKVLGQSLSASAGIAVTGNHGIRVQVRESQLKKAQKILLDHGYLGNIKRLAFINHKYSKTIKLVFIIAAILVVAIVTMIIFLNT